MAKTNLPRLKLIIGGLLLAGVTFFLWTGKKEPFQTRNQLKTVPLATTAFRDVSDESTTMDDPVVVAQDKVQPNNNVSTLPGQMWAQPSKPILTPVSVNRAKGTSCHVPVALLDPPRDWHLNDVQLSTWNNIRHDFAKAVGSPTQNAYDLGYQNRWRQAQLSSDDRFRILFGDEAYDKMKLQAIHQGETTFGQ